MKLYLISICFIFSQIFPICSFCQKSFNKNHVTLSAGRVLFGTGDVAGFGVAIEGSRNLLKTSRPFLSRLLLGPEFLFENGAQNPKVINPTVQDILYGNIFQHTSTSTFTPKLTYYPFSKIIPGLHIAAGLSVGYTFQSREFQATGVPLQNGQSVRQSYLEFNNGWIWGYRVSTGYEFQINKIIAGIGLYFSNYTNGDINTLAALRIGYNF